MILQTWESLDKIVRKDVIKSGHVSKKPTECSKCEISIGTVNVVNASVEDLKKEFKSEILDGSSRKTLIIGEANCEIDRQIERAIQMMNVLEMSLITLHPSLEGVDKPITITFETILNKIEPYKPIWEWTPEEKYSIALKYKKMGVHLFKECRYVDAFHRFSKACKILITLEPIHDLELDAKLESDINNLRLVLYNNMAGCQLNRKNYEHTISLCTKVLDKENNNVKALYRRGVAHGNLNDVERAVNDLKIATALEPHNSALKEQFLICNKKLQEANQKFEDMVRKMFKT
ncbi:peptidyl-prolyl cis-trans isomerase FKBP62-like [Osmia bicornis bicornis]|uniref:peptidyl-prolyl cis-trans isomerase FKBP62-like n=1 Tax=Osmia bicornis bicornis TaxID=1437191 RepID=UPI0010F5B0AA|nr:peptidyl-prolyl cis-trans isomerase FKBP62-like [Osmia bicornis bicornis]